MLSKQGNVLPLFINVIIQESQVGSLFTSGLLQPRRVDFFILKECFLLTQKCYCEVSIIIAID